METRFRVPVPSQSRSLVQALMALVVAAACGSDNTVATVSPTPTPTFRATPTPTPQASATPIQPSPTPPAIFDNNFGFLVYKVANDPTPGPVGWWVRREGDPQPTFPLHTGNAGELKVSPDGRHVAYWVAKELRVLDVTPDARPRTLLTMGSKESAYYIAWSSDGTGLVVGVHGPGTYPDAPPLYTAIRVVDVKGGSPREIVRVPNADITALAWDRKAHLIAAHEASASGIRSYDTITEAGTLKRVSPGSEIYFPQASDDGQHVFGRDLNFKPPFGSTLLRVWPVGSFAGGVELHATGGKAIRAAEWRPGTAEIGVLFDDHLEFWNANGARRSQPLPHMPPLPASHPNASLLFRADGNGVVIGRALGAGSDVYVLALELPTGQSAVIDWNGLPGPGLSVRLGP